MYIFPHHVMSTESGIIYGCTTAVWPCPQTCKSANACKKVHVRTYILTSNIASICTYFIQQMYVLVQVHELEQQYYVEACERRNIVLLPIEAQENYVYLIEVI